MKLNKILKYISSSILSTVLLVACTEDDKVTYNPNNVQPGVLADIESSYILKVEEAANPTFNFNWGAMDFGFSAAPTYEVQIDLNGQEFANAYTVASGTTTSAIVTTAALNNAMMALQKLYGFSDGTAQNIDIRVAASLGSVVAPVFSNVINSSITPYKGKVSYPFIYVVGNYCGWKFLRAENPNVQYLFDYTKSGVYTGYIFLDGNSGFKLTGDADWNHGNWGTDGSATDPEDEAASVTLIDDGGSGNISCYTKNYYKFTFEKSSLKLTRNKGFNSLGIVGSINNWGNENPDGTVTPDTPMEFDPETQTFYAIVTLKADDQIKFRADNTWDGGINLTGADGKLSASGANLQLPAGTWKITIDINNEAEMTYSYEAAEALDPTRISAPVLNDIDAEISVAKTSDVTFGWDAVDFDGQKEATVNYTLLVDESSDFSTASTLTTTKDLLYTTTGQTFLDLYPSCETAAKTLYVKVSAAVTGVSVPYVSESKTFAIKVLNEVALPTQMYIIGLNGWGWDTDAIEMTPVNGTPGVFWAIKKVGAESSFKFSEEKAWGKDFTALDADASVGFVESSGNIVASTAGFYQIIVEVKHADATKQAVVKTVKIIAPAIYLMGNTATNVWSGAIDADKFTYDDANGVFVSPKFAASDALRMYVLIDGYDWWKSEFNIYDGAIVLRGNGGDQAAVNVTKDQVAKLNFETMTATIE